MLISNIHQTNNITILHSSKLLKELDPFGSQKQLAFTSSLTAMTALASHVLKICDTIKAVPQGDQKEKFTQFFQVRNIISAHYHPSAIYLKSRLEDMTFHCSYNITGLSVG